MDQTQLQQLIAQFYEKLDPDAQKVFERMEWMDTLRTISLSYALTGEQIATLGTETTLVLLGIITLDEYKENLKKEIPIGDGKLDPMIAEINKKIIMAIEPALEKTYKENVEDINLLALQQEEEEVKEVPLPPYKKHEEEKKEAQKETLPVSGIEVDHSVPLAMPTPVNLIADKLSGMTKSPQKVTDYTIPKIRPLDALQPSAKDVVPTPPPGALPTNPHDSYHEEI